MNKITPEHPDGQAETNLHDPVEQLHALEFRFQAAINPDRAVRDSLRDAIMALVNYGRYEAGERQYKDWDEYIRLERPDQWEEEQDEDPNDAACNSPKGHAWNEDSFCSHCGADGAA